jgi:hypothetical protein
MIGVGAELVREVLEPLGSRAGELQGDPEPLQVLADPSRLSVALPGMVGPPLETLRHESGAE